MNELRLKASKAQVLLHGKVAGILIRVASDEYRFQYDSAYRSTVGALPLSLSLPLSQPSFQTENLLPFFDNLLMEGKSLRRMSKEFGLNAKAETDRFKLLMVCAKDTIGAVEIQPLDANDRPIPFEREAPALSEKLEFVLLHSPYADRCPICLKLGDWHSACSMNLAGTRSALSIAIDSQDPRSIFQVLPAGSSISGAQEKSLFRVKRGQFLPEIPSTHIIKPDGDYPEMPANEHLTMTIARRAKFLVPWTGLFRVDGLGLVYVIKRFDRLPKGQRILLEDFAQILSYMESDKEEGSMEEIAAGIDRYCSSPVIEKGEFFRRVLFSFVFCNGDMHLKNWSLAYDPLSRLYKMSPVYDWLNVRASMPREKVEMILPLGGKRTGFDRRDFEAFSKDVLKLGSKFVLASFADVPNWLKIAEELCLVSALSGPMKKSYLELVQKRASRIL